jgi:hypothetical protein
MLLAWLLTQSTVLPVVTGYRAGPSAEPSPHGA